MSDASHAGASHREMLSEMLSGDDPAPALWAAVNSGLMGEIVPEFPALRMEQNHRRRHKDVLAHTIAVVAMSPDEPVVRLAALFHDIGKPLTRRYSDGEVTFRHHEVVGARITRGRLTVLEFDADVVDDVSELVRLSGRFKGYDSGWSDSAVRRYARDAGHLLGWLNQLVRVDCTTRDARKRARLHAHVDDLERRIIRLAAAERRAAERPQMNGDAVMARLGIGSGPHVGRALAWLLELKRSHGELEIDDLHSRLDAWWAENRPAHS